MKERTPFATSRFRDTFAKYKSQNKIISDQLNCRFLSEYTAVMKFFYLLSLLSIVFLEKSHGAPINKAKPCIIQYLKDVEKLEQDFPMPNGYNKTYCTSFIELTQSYLEKELRDVLSKEDEIDCIMQEFAKIALFDYTLKLEVLEEATHMKGEEQKLQIHATTHEVKQISENVAKTCNSNTTYGGFFDEDLGAVNSSKGVNDPQYCFARYVIEHDFIDLKNLKARSENNSTSSIDCEAIVSKERTRIRNSVEGRLKNEKFPNLASSCTMKLFDSEKVFEWGLASKVLEGIEVSSADKARNFEVFKEKRVDFLHSLLDCSRDAKSGDNPTDNRIDPAVLVYALTHVYF